MNEITGKNAILSVLALSLAAFAGFSAEASYPVNKNSSVYYYHSLENKASLPELLATRNLALLEAEAESEASAEIEVVAAPQPTRALFIRSEVIDEDDFQAAWAELTAKQSSVIEQAEKAIEVIENKSEIGTVFLGNNLGTLEFLQVQITGLQASLNSLIPKTVDVEAKLKIREQIEALKEEERKVEILLVEKEDQFSLLGWLVATI